MNDKEDRALDDAKRTLKAHIKFFETLLSHLKSNDEVNRTRAQFATFVLHRYMQNHFVPEIEQLIQQIKGGVH